MHLADRPHSVQQDGLRSGGGAGAADLSFLTKMWKLFQVFGRFVASVKLCKGRRTRSGEWGGQPHNGKLCVQETSSIHLRSVASLLLRSAKPASKKSIRFRSSYLSLFPEITCTELPRVASASRPRTHRQRRINLACHRRFSSPSLNHFPLVVVYVNLNKEISCGLCQSHGNTDSRPRLPTSGYNHLPEARQSPL